MIACDKFDNFQYLLRKQVKLKKVYDNKMSLPKCDLFITLRPNRKSPILPRSHMILFETFVNEVSEWHLGENSRNYRQDRCFISNWLEAVWIHAQFVVIHVLSRRKLLSKVRVKRNYNAIQHSMNSLSCLPNHQQHRQQC